jgi:Cu/Ag efflux pump CusA
LTCNFLDSLASTFSANWWMRVFIFPSSLPMFLLSGVVRYLFLPLAEAVVFAMLAPYFLSRTIVPTMAKYLLRGQNMGKHAAGSGNVFVRLRQRFEAGFEAFRESYHRLLESCLNHRRLSRLFSLQSGLGSLALIVRWLGQDFFPTVDAGSLDLHMRGPTGMRIEDTAYLCKLLWRSSIVLPIPGTSSIEHDQKRWSRHPALKRRRMRHAIRRSRTSWIAIMKGL